MLGSGWMVIGLVGCWLVDWFGDDFIIIVLSWVVVLRGTSVVCSGYGIVGVGVCLCVSVGQQ